MQPLNTDRVRELYAEADHYTEGHARQDLQVEEFNAWLAKNDADLELRVVEELMALIESTDKNIWSRNADLWTKFNTRLEAAHAAAGVEVKR
ncbi:hypothetical protein [Antiquaquibacter soli]|uniref:Uncharacterized protein n=1 Tax=Antiquaquibacter soli TaxID=3064523 RepID=A0ABT9BL89_9MICO|nr:hypothetical protein [Protaetiibacter sp. WY-16]MDO7881776.1 hypothetical protein [Protaetiibacter sp. WY-16]